MKGNEKISAAIGMLDEEMIADADKRRNSAKKRPVRSIVMGAGALAACAALVTGGVMLMGSPSQSGMLAAAAEYPKVTEHPGNDTPNIQRKKWMDEQKSRRSIAFETPLDFYKRTSDAFLTGSDENRVYSPLNVYISLSALAETVDSSSREQVLDLLGAKSIGAQRDQANAIWRANYQNDGVAENILANSLWLSENIDMNKSTANRLADSYYTSVYRGDMGDPAMTKALQDWLNEQTGDLLKENVKNVELTPEMAMALCSTIYFRGSWDEEFLPQWNTDGKFHGRSGDTDVTYMNRSVFSGNYYYSDNYGAASLSFEDGAQMWFILPDEGKTTDDVLREGAYLDMVCTPDSWADKKSLWIDFSVPKFDVGSDIYLENGLKKLGVTDIFDSVKADFSPISKKTEGFAVDSVEHAARVVIDEKGCTAAAYTVYVTEGSAEPMDDRISFTVDRPFIFVITSDVSQPLFIGVVNNVN